MPRLHSTEIHELFDIDEFCNDLGAYKDHQHLTMEELGSYSEVSPVVIRMLFRGENWNAVMFVSILKLANAADLSMEKYIRR